MGFTCLNSRHNRIFLSAHSKPLQSSLRSSPQFLLSLANSIVHLTNKFSSQIPPNERDDDENGYAVQICNLLCSFASKHVRKCVTVGFKVTDFMTACGNMTFKVSTYPALCDVMRTWIEVAEFADVKGEGVGKGFSGETGRGAKRRADNVSVRKENHSRLYLHARHPPYPTTAIILTHHPNLFRDSLWSSQRFLLGSLIRTFSGTTGTCWRR